MKALQARTKARVTYVDGKDAAAAAKAAAGADVAIVFATQWAAESLDAPSMALPDNQDALIAAVAGANKRTVVVLETGNPVTMPWLDNVGAVLAEVRRLDAGMISGTLRLRSIPSTLM